MEGLSYHKKPKIELENNCHEVAGIEQEKMQGLTNIEKEASLKEGVDFVFEQNPELAHVGTPEEYCAYMDTIFPKSQVRDIVYHGTASKQKIDHFDFNRSNYANAVFFTKDKKFAETYAYDEIRDGLVQCQILDIKNPFDYSSSEKIEELRPIIQELISRTYKSPTGVSFLLNNQGMQVGDKFIENPSMDDAINHYMSRIKNGAWRIIETPPIVKFLSEKYDSIKISEHQRENIAVFKPEQVHVLGSLSDIQKFKEYIHSQKSSNL